MRTIAVTALLLTITGAMAAGNAVHQPLPASTLIDNCRRFSSDMTSEPAKLCEFYIQGFLAGVRKGGLLRSNVGAKNAGTKSVESFSERAWRTRLGQNARSPTPQYCLANDTKISELVTRLLARAETPASASESSAAQLLTGVLRGEYACGR